MRKEMFTPDAPGELRRLSGEYATRYGLMQYDTYSFVPNPLGDYPTLSPRVMGVVSRASMALARLSELGEDLPNPDMLRRPTMRREAQSTSALEGTFEPLETVLAQDYEVGEDKSGLSESMREVLNYLDAAECGIGQIQAGHPISLSLIRELQQLLVKGTKSDNPQAGDIRSTQVFIGSPTRRIEDARFVPMPPGQDLDIAVRSLVDWWRSRNEPGLAVLDMAMFHYQFETMQPFTDGNGRIGRLLVLLQMMSRGLLSQPLLSVSPWFERRRPEYQDRLLGVSTKGDWENWILFFCQGVEESCEDALLRVKRLVNVRQKYRSLLDAHNYSGLSVQTAMYLIGQPTVTTRALRRRFGKSPSAVQHALSRLVSVGILRVYPSGRGNLYFAPDVHEVLSAPLGAEIDVSAPLMCERSE